MEQIFLITEYATEVNNLGAAPTTTEPTQPPVETQAAPVETFPEGNVG